jgi:hypothetical protein
MTGYPVSMLLPCAVFALLTVGFVIPCAIDVAMTPSEHFDAPSKQTWLVVAVAFWAFGSAAWLLVGRRDTRMRAACNDLTASWGAGDETTLWPGIGHRSRPGRSSRPGPQMALAPTRFIAPDDNPDFLLELDRRIRGWRDDR